jgi:dolichol kinase
MTQQTNETKMNEAEATQPQKPKAKPETLANEFWRKSLHMLPGFLPFWFMSMPHTDPLDPEALNFITVVAVSLTAIFIALRRVVSRHGESDFLLTTISYPAIILTVLWMFPKRVEFVCVIVIVLAFGDGSAFIGGKLFGKRKLPWNRDKSWAGMISFILVAAPVASLAFWLEARPALPATTAIASACVATVLAAIAESIDTKLTDNLRVGLAAAIGVIGMGYLL